MLTHLQDWKKDDGTQYIKRLTKLRVLRTSITKRVSDDMEAQRKIVLAWAAVNPTLEVIWLTRWQRWTKCDGDWVVAGRKVQR